MLNFFNFRKLEDQYLITNDAGQYEFISKNILGNILKGTLNESDEVMTNLCSKGFIYEKSRESFLEDQRNRLRFAKGHLFHGTSLHIFILTNACNLQCVYCQARTGNEEQFEYMNEETAERAVDFALSSPEDNLTFEFQGGEPLLNFNVIRHIVEYTESRKGEKHIEYSLVSNLLLMDQEKIKFIRKYHIGISTSLDGDRLTHNENRPYIDGKPSFDDVVEKIHEMRLAEIQVGTIETTTRNSLKHPKEIIDAFLDLGFNSAFIRPLTPLGYATKNWKDIGYTSEEFLNFYKACFDYILQLNCLGIKFCEGHASIFLRKIIHGEDPNYMELRSPCGGVVGQLAYFFNGDIYTCDEGRMMGEMGDFSFRLGNVYHNTYYETVCSNKCKALLSASYLESLPECCDCAYQPYCGTCPVVNLALKGDIFPVESNDYKCKIYRGILDLIFKTLMKEGKEAKALREWVE